MTRLSYSLFRLLVPTSRKPRHREGNPTAHTPSYGRFLHIFCHYINYIKKIII